MSTTGVGGKAAFLQRVAEQRSRSASEQLQDDLWRVVDGIAATAGHGAPVLVHCVTNFVSMDIMANVLLAAKASPVMIHEPDEIADIVAVSRAVLVNIGTISRQWEPGMRLACQVAQQRGVPWVLDPVGVGATRLRREFCEEVLGYGPAVIRGNDAEIRALASIRCTAQGPSGQQAGVDGANCGGAAALYDETIPAAQRLALSTKAVVIASGEIDVVTDGTRTLLCSNGHCALPYVTASGCAMTSLIAAFVGLNCCHPLVAAAAALSLFNISAEYAAEQCGPRGTAAAGDTMCLEAFFASSLTVRSVGPASLRTHLIDTIYTLTREEYCSRLRVWEDVRD